MNEEQQYAIPATMPFTVPGVSQTDLYTQSRGGKSINEILAERAKEFAREAKVEIADDAESLEVLEFGLADEKYAFDLSHVREVGALTDLTPLPGVPPFIIGITCVHGQIIAVVDMRRIFGLAERTLNDTRQAIIIQSDKMEFAVLAEHVAGVRRIPLSTMQSSLPTLTDVRAAYLEGVTQDGVVVLSASKLLADQQLIVNQSK